MIRLQAQRDWKPGSKYRIIVVKDNKQIDTITDYIYDKHVAVSLCDSLNKLIQKETEFFDDIDKNISAEILNNLVESFKNE